MPTKIRLQRKGKKGQPFYHLVIADGRAPRDGKFIEKIGTYNPMTHPASIDINFDRALYWVQVGAQPTDTARSILSREGVMLKHHLLKGAKKGALTIEQVEEKFKTWLKDKSEKLDQTSKDLELTEKEQQKKRLEEEKKVNQARAEALAKKLAKEAKKAEGADDSEEEVSEEVAEETPEAAVETPEAVVETPEAAVETPKAAVETPEAVEDKPEVKEEAAEAETEEKKEE